MQNINFKTTNLVLSIALTTILLNSADTAFCASYSGSVIKNYTQIERLIEKGRYQEAQDQCETLLRKNPNDMDARTQLGSLYSAQYKLDAASKEFSKVLSQNPNNAMAHNGLGLVYYKKTTSSDMDIRKNTYNFYQSALNEFKAAISADPNFYKAYANIAKVLYETGKINDAQKYYKKALDLEPNYSEAHEGMGMVLLAKNELRAAIDKYKEAIELNNKNSSAYYHLGEALIANGEYGKAIKELQTSLYLFPNSAPVHDMLGKAYEMQGNEAAAITEYNKAIMIKPEYTPSYLKIANIYQNRGDEEIAISELKNAVSINSNFPEGKLKIADMSLKIDKTEQAIKYYKEITNDKNYKSLALKGLANAYFAKAQEASIKGSVVSEYDYVEVEDALKQALNYAPKDLELYLALLRVTKLTSTGNQSSFYLSKIIDSSDYRPIGHIIKGEALSANKQYREAADEFKQALYQLDNTEDLQRIGEIFIVNRQYQLARSAFNRVLMEDPGNVKAKRSIERISRNESQAISKYNIGLGFYKEGQKMAAIEAFRDALSLDPNIPNTHLLIAKCFENQKYYFNALEHYKAYVNLVKLNETDQNKYNAKIEKLTDKIEKMKFQNKPIKKYSRI